MLEFRGVHAGYGAKEVIRGLDFTLPPGKILALIGPNGAGKSTVIKAIAGIADCTAGDMVFEGRSLRGLGTHELLGRGIGYVNQGRVIFENLTVEENLRVAAEASPTFRFSWDAVDARFPVLRGKKNFPANVLSGGERQQLALARALLHRPRLLMMDEPSLGLSPRRMHDLFTTVATVAAEGTAVLLVEQNARQAIRIAHRTLLLTDGRAALEGGPEILGDERIRRIYLGG